ncbi:response regulator [Candidatus Parcubacteria bacterium]|jgi:DNA-binding response OmpR family regulator|nr:response regulator [Candidatus Parcubacteria bacterium]MBT7228331.1 response regulator [Candidatus Parcubacteria bacterium]
MEDKKVLLIVEDDLALAKALVGKFSKENFQLLEAKNGEEGLKLALDKKPDLILLDIVMPRMDGISMLKELRQDDWGKGVPVIILSNLADAQDNSEIIQEHIVDYLIKTDWSLEDIVKKVKDTLK